MSKSDEHIKELLKATREHDICRAPELCRYQILVDYSGEELDDMEDIPGWEYLMSIAEKLYEQYEEEIEEGTYDWMIFEYGPNRFMVWGELADFIEDMKENAEIEAAYE